jgi:hypothetical protein
VAEDRRTYNRVNKVAGKVFMIFLREYLEKVSQLALSLPFQAWLETGHGHILCVWFRLKCGLSVAHLEHVHDGKFATELSYFLDGLLLLKTTDFW